MTMKFDMLRPDDLLNLEVEGDNLRLAIEIDKALIGGPSTDSGTQLKG